MEPAILVGLLNTSVSSDQCSESSLRSRKHMVCNASCLESPHLSTAMENSWNLKFDLWVRECSEKDSAVDSLSMSGCPLWHLLRLP